MESIRELYKAGKGPSSSHTMGPRKAAERFLQKSAEAPAYRVTLFGSLAATGLGHLTHKTIEEAFQGRNLEIVWKPETFLPRHPNALTFESLDEAGKPVDSWTAYSVGGGAIVDDQTEKETKPIYPHSSLKAILDWCLKEHMDLWEYVQDVEGEGIWDFLREIWQTMQESIQSGIGRGGLLPGEIRLPRKAAHYYRKSGNFSEPIRRRALLFSFALAVSEENASGGTVVTAPTCGASGVLPAILYQQKVLNQLDETLLLQALATAGLIGNLVKRNASISGAEAGCQAEIGTACAMASAALTQLLGGTVHQIEYAAEMGMEHHLGLTCDPLYGLVQIPCIERNAFAAARAVNHSTFALLSDQPHVISFDQVVEAMMQTGTDLSDLYKETSLGGLALFGKRSEQNAKS